MTTREIIMELEKQKANLNKSFFDLEMLETYLKLTTTVQEKTLNIDIHGIGDLQTINTKLGRIYPFQTANQTFNKARGPWHQLYQIARKTDVPVTITIKHSPAKQYHKKQKTNIYNTKRAA